MSHLSSKLHPLPKVMAVLVKHKMKYVISFWLFLYLAYLWFCHVSFVRFGQTLLETGETGKLKKQQCQYVIVLKNNMSPTPVDPTMDLLRNIIPMRWISTLNAAKLWEVDVNVAFKSTFGFIQQMFDWIQAEAPPEPVHYINGICVRQIVWDNHWHTLEV